MAKITTYLETAKETLFSFEILPPLKGESINMLFNAIEPLMAFKPPFIDVTYHREEYVYKKLDNGLLQKQIVRKRPGTVGICAAIMNRFKVEAVMHLICGGFTKEETENALIDLKFLGIDNVLALRGDSVASEPKFIPQDGGHAYSTQLIKQITDFNNGIYLDDEIKNADKSNFCIGVSGYPEKHFEAPNMQQDLAFLKQKVDLGAQFVVTQMFFDNQKYFNFVAEARKLGITIPIIPGLKPITTKAQINNLPRIFSIDIPTALTSEMAKVQSDSEAKSLGIEWCINQSKELMAAGVPCLHYYSMSKSDAIVKVASQLF